MTADLAILSEIESAVATAPRERRGDMLRRVTDLFIVGASGYSDDEVEVFDQIIARLAADIEISARAMLSFRLAPIANAPPRMIRALAFDDCVDVAGPVLELSERLDELSLIEAATLQGQEHLLAISRRRTLGTLVTDVLVTRGDPQVVLSTVGNAGAKFSDAGFATLVEKAEGNDQLAACVGRRHEIPPHLFVRLLASASAAVRRKLEAEYPQAKGEVGDVLAEIVGRVGANARAQARNFEAAQRTVVALREAGQLDDDKVRAFAKAARFEEVTAALASMCGLPLEFAERAMYDQRLETVLVLARASGLSWSTMKAILLMRLRRHFTSGSEIAQTLAKFERLQPGTAQHIVRQYRGRAQGAAPPPS
jgi:uncharacterized protein (DUF2336 family)